MPFPTYPDRTTESIEFNKRRLKQAEAVIKAAEDLCFRSVTPLNVDFPAYTTLCDELLKYREIDKKNR